MSISPKSDLKRRRPDTKMPIFTPELQIWNLAEPDPALHGRSTDQRACTQSTHRIDARSAEHFNKLISTPNGFELVELLGSAPPDHIVDIIPVSYTHLDVYKRQARRIARPP